MLKIRVQTYQCAMLAALLCLGFAGGKAQGGNDWDEVSPAPSHSSVPGIRGDVGLKMDPHGQSRVPGVLVQRGLRQLGARRSWNRNDSAGRGGPWPL